VDRGLLLLSWERSKAGSTLLIRQNRRENRHEAQPASSNGETSAEANEAINSPDLQPLDFWESLRIRTQGGNGHNDKLGMVCSRKHAEAGTNNSGEVSSELNAAIKERNQKDLLLLDQKSLLLLGGGVERTIEAESSSRTKRSNSTVEKVCSCCCSCCC
jgi:hypothetical protein